VVEYNTEIDFRETHFENLSWTEWGEEMMWCLGCILTVMNFQDP